MIVQFNSRVSSVKIFDVKSDFIFNKVIRIKTVRFIDTEFIHSLSYKYLFSEMLSEIFHLLSEVLNI